MSLISELKRRNVFKVGVAYLALGWVLVQITDVMVPALNLPEVITSIVAYIWLIFLPISLFVAWAFELTPDGMKRTTEVDEDQSIRHSTGQKINYIIIGLMAIAIMFLLYDRSGEQEEVIVAEAPVEVELANTIAVMPFADMSADGDQEYFGDGMAEEILNVLVSIDELDVTSRTTAFSLKGEGLSVPEIAERLNVDYILEGSIRSAGNRVRITAQLIDVAADTHLWSETYDRDLTDIFAIQDEISVAIADALKVELLNDVLGDVPTQNMEAYALFLQARRLLDAPSYDKVVKVGDLANQMIKLDPNYADAWSLLAAFYVNTINTTFTSLSADEVSELEELAMEAAEKAIRLDPNNGYGWANKGKVHLDRLEWKEAESAAKQSTLVGSKDAGNWLRLGFYYEAIGAYDDALNAHKISLKINSEDTNAFYSLIEKLIILENIEQSRVELENTRFQGFSFITYAGYLLSIMEMEQEKSIELFKNFHQRAGVPTENIEQFINAYYDPSLREETKKLLTVISHDNLRILSNYALLLQDGEYFVEILRRLKSSGIRGLIPPFRPILNQQVVKDYFQEIGLVEHWREVGFPTFCRPVGDDDFECDAGDAP